MQKYNLPTRRECFDILAEYRVPPHIVGHSLAVAKLAVFLAQRLKDKGIAVDIDLVDRACLLHDLLRVFDFKQTDYSRFEQDYAEDVKAQWRRLRERYRETPHEHAAHDILKQKYPALAVVIRKHRYMSLLDEDDKPDTWEEKLVYYADKRVMHEKIVPLKERLCEGHRRNIHLHGTEAQSRINTAKVDPLIREMQKEISEMIGLDAGDVTDEFIDSYADNQQDER